MLAALPCWELELEEEDCSLLAALLALLALLSLLAALLALLAALLTLLVGLLAFFDHLFRSAAALTLALFASFGSLATTPPPCCWPDPVLAVAAGWGWRHSAGRFLRCPVRNRR